MHNKVSQIALNELRTIITNRYSMINSSLLTVALNTLNMTLEDQGADIEI